MKMTIPYNITGKQRKQLAEDASVALHTIPKYQGSKTDQCHACLKQKMRETSVPKECPGFSGRPAFFDGVRRYDSL